MYQCIEPLVCIKTGYWSWLKDWYYWECSIRCKVTFHVQTALAYVFIDGYDSCEMLSRWTAAGEQYWMF